MKFFTWGIICLVFLSFMFTGCGDRGKVKDFLAIKPGVIWYYEVDIQGAKSEMQIQVGEPKEIEGKTAYPLSYSYNQLALPTQIEYYVIQDKSVLFPRIDNVQGQFSKKPAQTFLKFPLKKGDKWEWSGKLVPVGEKEAVVSGSVKTVVEDEETVTTPAATYKKAVRISLVTVHESQGTKFELKEERWYVNKIGMVKDVLYDEKGNPVLTAVLKKIQK